jgi:hypothetical protein
LNPTGSTVRAWSLLMRVRLELTLLAIITAAGAWLRLHDLGGPSLWLDEILSYDIATKAAPAPWGRWLTSTFEPEHGPLFHASLLAGRFLAQPESSARVIAAICGVVTIPLIWIAARRLGAIVALVAAILMAWSPLNVYYSRDGRPYALLMMLTTAALAAFATRARWVAFALIALALAYTSGTAAPVLVAIAIAAIAIRDRTAAFCALAGAIAIALVYRNHSPGAAITSVPAIDFGRVLQSFATSALLPSDAWRIAYVVFVFAVIGAITLVLRDRKSGIVLITMAVLPAAIAWIVLRWLQHWFEIRYLSVSLPAYLILAAAGMSWVAALIPKLEPAAVVIAGVVAFKALPSATSEPYRKLDWRLIAQTIWIHTQPNDIVVAANDWTSISLGFYLQRLPPRVRMIDARESASTIEHFAAIPDTAWIVSSGFYRTNVFPGWLCRYPLMLASELEEFGLHYAHSPADFLQHRATPAEVRMLTSPFALTFSASDAPFLGEGWAGAEHIANDDARWVVGTAATIVVPVDAAVAHTLRVRMMPFSARGLSAQTVTVRADGTDVATRTMEQGWSVYDFAIAPDTWRAQRAHVITFTFARADVPAELNAGSTDRRRLSAMFTDLAFDAATPGKTGPVMFALRAQEPGRYLDDALWRGVRSQFKPRDWNRGALASFAARSGFDPMIAVPRLIDGSLSVEQIATSILDRGSCVDDIGFVRNAYWSIIGRSVGEDEARAIVKPWRGDRSRYRLVHGLIESSEFRERMVARPTE